MILLRYSGGMYDSSNEVMLMFYSTGPNTQPWGITDVVAILRQEAPSKLCIYELYEF